MNVLSIEPTPNPNSMKLTLDQTLPDGVKNTYTHDSAQRAPREIADLLAVPGVQSIFHVRDFLAIQRDPRVDWDPILATVRGRFETLAADEGHPASDALENYVAVQYFRSLPLLVKVSNGTEDKRVALAPRFTQAAQAARSSAQNMLMERRWIDEGVRYGTIDQVGSEVAEELEATYDDERLARLVERAFTLGTRDDTPPDSPAPATRQESLRRMDSEEWQVRFAAMKDLGADGIPAPKLISALNDDRMSNRRLAAVYLVIRKDEDLDTVPHLCTALRDEAVGVRRTAGDALNDLGDNRANEAMATTLGDPNKLVRWRAARFLYELGDDACLPALRDARDDSAYEVRMQVRQAIERIEGGTSPDGPVWQQMTQLRDEKE